MASPVLNNTIESPTMGTEEKQDLHLKALPIDELLPHHVIQYMIGFNGDLRHIELVNKTFHKSCKSSQRLFLRQQQTDWQKEFNDLHSDFGSNRMLNVYPSPRPLCNTLALAIRHAQSGDTLLIHEGVYVFEESYEMDKNIKLIGHGSNVIIRTSHSDESIELDFTAQYTYIQNIRFDIGGRYSQIYIEREGCSFYMETCFIYSNLVALEVAACKTIKIKNCVIKGGDYNQVAFDFKCQPDILEIESCVFENCCRNGNRIMRRSCHCIVLYMSLWVYESTKRANATQFRCVGNHFKNNFGLPIVATNPCELTELVDIQILNNTWCYNTTSNQDFVIPSFDSFQDVNANEIYPLTDIQK
eukprot:580454_1